MRLLDGMPYTPACATDIRRTFNRINDAADWDCRLEGAHEVMRKEQEKAEAARKVTDIATRRKTK